MLKITISIFFLTADKRKNTKRHERFARLSTLLSVSSDDEQLHEITGK